MSNYCFTLALLRLFDFRRAFDDFPLFHLWLSTSVTFVCFTKLHKVLLKLESIMCLSAILFAFLLMLSEASSVSVEQLRDRPLRPLRVLNERVRPDKGSQRQVNIIYQIIFGKYCYLPTKTANSI